ncbi:MAG TPA: metallophosphoesterase, partial [Acidimicrobiia bacterium]|nr:metallophosphoesterase [Acidimicrobiia bacterium]
GHITFHTATTTAYPLPHPGDGPGPKPLVVPADALGRALGIRQAHVRPGGHPLALIDEPLGT